MNLTKFQTKQGDKSRDDLIKDLYDAYKKIERIEKEKERLEKELHKYKNAHTPSSQKRFEKIEVQGLKVGRKKGYRMSGFKPPLHMFMHHLFRPARQWVLWIPPRKN